MMGFSAWYHLVACQSEQKMYFWRKFDLVGIVLQIMGSQVPPCYYSFYCGEDQKYFWRYIIFSWSICLAAGGVVMYPAGLKGKWKGYLCAFAFILAGWSTSPMCIHIGFYRDPNEHQSQFPLWCVGGCAYTLGAIIYAVKFPERCCKNAFDIFGSSHQIFHLAIFCAAVLHFYASINEFHMRQLN